MKTELIIALLGMACIGSLAAVFVLWAKLDEYKRMAADEHANYLAALNLHNTTAERAQWLEDRLQGAYREWDRAEQTAMQQQEECTKLWLENIEMQDRLSALLCPHNDHVWKDGVCVKCGRVQDD